MRYISADLIITNVGPPVTDSMVVLDGAQVMDVLPIDRTLPIEYYSGIIIPGFVNAHCHLELSHLKGAIAPDTGLIPFIRGVVGLRDFPAQEIADAIVKADQEMWKNGIVAVGDICNKTDALDVKVNSPIRYFSFVEAFDFMQDDNASQVFKEVRKVYDAHREQTEERYVSMVPHAPYSVSPTLFSLINEINGHHQNSVSIHNQELDAENELFRSKSGEFLDFYHSFGMSLDKFEAVGESSLVYAIKHLDKNRHHLFVHNTKTTLEDIHLAQSWSDQVFWVTCSNANLYIEGTIPIYDDFIRSSAMMCIGTDSLASNWSLSMLSEMKVIKKFYPQIADLELIKWATINGAMALGMDDEFGTIAKDRRPGINWISVEVDRNNQFDLSTALRVVKLG